MVDKSNQTPIHFYGEQGNPQPNYLYNEWDLKKKALQIADIMNKKTISIQTYLSHYRRENQTQVYPPKDKGINTMTNKDTNLSITRDYILGLGPIKKGSAEEFIK
jgi:hypothetical protein